MVIKIADSYVTIAVVGDAMTVAMTVVMTEVAETTDEVEVAMMTEVVEIIEVIIVVVVTGGTVMVVVVDIEVDHQDEIIAEMTDTIVEVTKVEVKAVHHVVVMKTAEETMGYDTMMKDVALLRTIINKNVMMTVAIVGAMTIVVKVATITKVVMKIVAVAHDRTHDLNTNTMIVGDTSKSETIVDKMSGHVHSSSVNWPDWIRLPLKKYRIDV